MPIVEYVNPGPSASLRSSARTGLQALVTPATREGCRWPIVIDTCHAGSIDKRHDGEGNLWCSHTKYKNACSPNLDA
eukprot:141147-Alexandrium_andersonii.AAC.1